jgi:hypothetical protein
MVLPGFRRLVTKTQEREGPMTNIDRNNKPTRKDRLRLIASGVELHFPSGQTILAGQTFNLPSDLVKLIQVDIDATNAADKVRADWLAAVQVQLDSHRKVAPVLRALKRLVLAQFGDTQDASSALADFGFTPLKVPAITAGAKATSVEKSRATRTARHTMGSKQKKLVKGTVETTAPSPATPAPTPAPGPAASVPSPGIATSGTAPHTS